MKCPYEKEGANGIFGGRRRTPTIKERIRDNAVNFLRFGTFQTCLRFAVPLDHAFIMHLLSLPRRVARFGGSPTHQHAAAMYLSMKEGEASVLSTTPLKHPGGGGDPPPPENSRFSISIRLLNAPRDSGGGGDPPPPKKSSTARERSFFLASVHFKRVLGYS